MRSFLWILILLYVNSAAADFPKLFNSEPLSDETLMPAENCGGEHATAQGDSSRKPLHLSPMSRTPSPCLGMPRVVCGLLRTTLMLSGSNVFQLDLRDRVVIFDNTTEDRFKTRTVFTDDVQMLTGIEVGLNGVWLMCPPNLIFIPDLNHDDVPDSAGEIVLDGFTVAQQNYHNFANGLQFGPDGWLYGRCGGSCPAKIGVPGTPEGERLALEGGIWRLPSKNKANRSTHNRNDEPMGA